MKRRIPVLGLLLIIPVIAVVAMDENTLSSGYVETIAPWVAENGVSGSCTGVGGLTLRYLRIQAPEERAAVVMLGGHSESYMKYAELFYDVRNSGLSIYALDLRGLGFSDRLLPDTEKDHVDRYEDYIEDLRIFLNEVVKPGSHRKLFIIGHSLGGAVAADYLARYPGDFDAAILSSPVIRMAATPFQSIMLRVLDFFGGGNGYVPGGGPFTPVSFEDNRETHSRARHERKLQDYTDFPETRLGHPTVHWYVEMLEMSTDILTRAGSVEVPVMILQAEIDDYGNTDGHEQFSSKASQTSVVRFPGAFHEILIETDEIRDRALAEMIGFLNEQMKER